MPPPSCITPMLAIRVAELPEGADWEYEVKWDGYRIEAIKSGNYLLRQALVRRRALLPQLLGGARVLFSGALRGTPAALMKAFRKHNLEGIVAKRKDSSYEPVRRSLAWQKLPRKPEQEFVI